MYISSPSLQPLIRIENLDSAFKAFEISTQISGGVAVFGSAAAYALVWELGSRRLTKPGPKTRWGINRNGERVILTKQAPRGYVGINASQYWKILRQELSRITVSRNESPNTWKLKLEVAVDNASQRMAQMIADSAPVDTGTLRSQIRLVDSDDSQSLKISNAASDTVLIV